MTHHHQMGRKSHRTVLSIWLNKEKKTHFEDYHRHISFHYIEGNILETITSPKSISATYSSIGGRGSHMNRHTYVYLCTNICSCLCMHE